MAASLELEKAKSASLSRLASAAYLAFAPLELRQRIGEQEAEMILLKNELKSAKLRGTADGR